MIQLILDASEALELLGTDIHPKLAEKIIKELNYTLEDGTTLTPMFVPLVIVDRDGKVLLVRRKELATSYSGFQTIKFDIMDNLSEVTETVTLKAQDFKWVLESYMNVADVEVMKGWIKW